MSWDKEQKRVDTKKKGSWVLVFYCLLLFQLILLIEKIYEKKKEVCKIWEMSDLVFQFWNFFWNSWSKNDLGHTEFKTDFIFIFLYTQTYIKLCFYVS